MPRPLALCIGGLLLAGCEHHHPPAPTPPPPTVVTTAVGIEDVAVYRHYPATSISIQPVAIVPRVAGWVREQNFTNGQMVSKGQQLYLIDPDPFVAALDRAEAAVAVAQAELFNARQQYERNQPLLEAEAISPEDLERLEANFMQAEAQVKVAQAEAEIARLNLSYCTVSSPVDGQLSATTLYVGDYAKVDPSNPLVTVQPLDPLWVQFMAISDDLDALRSQFGSAGPGVEISLPDGSWHRSGPVVFIDNTVMPGTAMIQVRVEVANADHAILPGTYLNARFRQRLLEKAMTVPVEAVVRQAAESVVWIVDENETARIRIVTLGPIQKGRIAILSGLSASDRVIVQGQSRLRVGVKVQTLTPDRFHTPGAGGAAASTPAAATAPAAAASPRAATP